MAIFNPADIMDTVLSIVGIILGGAFLLILKKIRELSIKAVKGIGATTLNKNFVKSYNNVMQVLSEIRGFFDSDRVYVFQFHNGNEFTTKNPIWKITRTHETCADGVEYETAKFQDMNVYNVMDLLSHIIDSNCPEANGIKRLCPKCQNNKYCINSALRSAILIDVDQMSSSYAKQMLAVQGIKKMLWTNLTAGHNDAKLVGVYGLVGIDFCGDIDDSKLEKICDNIQTLCLKTDKISFYIQEDIKIREINKNSFMVRIKKFVLKLTT